MQNFVSVHVFIFGGQISIFYFSYTSPTSELAVLTHSSFIIGSYLKFKFVVNTISYSFRKLKSHLLSLVVLQLQLFHSSVKITYSGLSISSKILFSKLKYNYQVKRFKFTYSLQMFPYKHFSHFDFPFPGNQCLFYQFQPNVFFFDSEYKSKMR